MKLPRSFIIAISFFFSLSGYSQCLLLVGKDTLISSTVDDKPYYSAPKPYIDQLQCIDSDFLQADLNKVNQLQHIINEYKKITDNLEQRVKAYQHLIDSYNNTLNNSVELTSKFDNQLERYQSLSQDYYQLVEKYDDLSSRYRAVASNSSHLFNVDIGVGANEDGNPTGLLGIGFRNLKVWGVLQDENSALMIGGSFAF